MAIPSRDVAIRMTALIMVQAIVLPALAAQGSGQVRASPTLEGYASINQVCREWSDGCAVCQRQGDGTIGCSLPGIACQPVAIACRSPLDPGGASPAVPDAP